MTMATSANSSFDSTSSGDSEATFTMDQSHRIARRVLCAEIADVIALQETLDAVFETIHSCFAHCREQNRFQHDDKITQNAFEALEKLAAATNTSNVPDALEIVSALFLLVVSGRFFKQHPTTVMDSWQLVRCMDDEEDQHLTRSPIMVQVDVLRMLVPTLLSALERMTELQQYHMFNDAAEHVADLCDSPAVEQEILSTRIPSAVQVLCLDFDDTIYIHEHIPEMFDVYEMVQGFMDPLVLNDMLNAGVPHRRFLLCLVDSMLASGRDVFIVSFGRDEWVLPAAAAVFGDRIPENHIFTRSNEPNGIEPPDKTVWLWEIAAHCGVAPHQVQLVDDAFTNHRTAVEQGFSSIKVSPHEGLHWGVWRQELMLRALSTCRLTSRLASLANAPWAAHLATAQLAYPGMTTPPAVMPRDSAENVLPRPPPRTLPPSSKDGVADPAIVQIVDGAIEQVVDEMFAVDWHRAASQKMESILATRSEDELELHCVGSNVGSAASSVAGDVAATPPLRSRTTSLDSIEGRRAAAHAAAAAAPIVLGTGTMPPSPAWGVVEPDALARMQQHAAALAATQQQQHAGGLEGKMAAAVATGTGTAISTTIDDSEEAHTRNASSSSESDLGSHVSHSASSSLSIAFEQLSTAPLPEDMPRIEEGSQDGESTMVPTTMVLSDSMAIVPVAPKKSRGWLRGRRAVSLQQRGAIKDVDKVPTHTRLGIVGRAKEWLRKGGKLRGKGTESPTSSVAASDKLG